MSTIVNNITMFLSAFLIAVFGFFGNANVQAQTAEVQVIHNAADPAFNVVDIYANGDILLDSVAFRAATSFLELPAGTELEIDVVPFEGELSESVFNTTLTLTENEVYYVIATGVGDPSSFADNPDGVSIGFTLDVVAGGSQTSSDAENVDFLVYHGATDAPAVDVNTGGNTIAADLSYTDVTANYISVPDAEYVLDINAAGTETTVASFVAPLEGLNGSTAMVLASGFLDPSANNDGAAFGLIAVLPNGNVVSLPAYEEPALDPETLIFSEYIEGSSNNKALELYNPNETAVSLTDYRIAQSVNGGGWEYYHEFPEGAEIAPMETYVIITDAVSPDLFDAANANEVLGFPSVVHHNGDDARAIIYVSGTDTALVDVFGDPNSDPGSGWDVAGVTSATQNHTLVRKTSVMTGNTTPLGSFGTNADDSEWIVNDEDDFSNLGIYGEPAPAMVQIIHNAADPAFNVVDIYANGEILLDSVAFRAATPFLELPSRTELNIDVVPYEGELSESVYNTSLTLTENESYYVVAQGVSDPSAFAENPSEVSTAFMLDVIAGAMMTADDGTVNVAVYHGATDAPAVDVNNAGSTLVPGLSYTDISDGYLNLPADDYILDINAAGTETTVASFTAPLSGLGGSSTLVLASGFLTPADNADGPAFGLIAVLPSGDVVALPVYEEPSIAQVQIIHNAADPAFEVVDIYANGEILLDSVAFRAATGFLELEAGVEYELDIAPFDAGIEASVYNTALTLEAGENYYVVATGVSDPSSFAVNPDGENTAFMLDVISGAALSGEAEEFAFKIYHGATDAPSVDIDARGVTELAANVPYTGYTPDYLTVPLNSYTIDVLPAGTEEPVASFTADVSGLGGATGIILASGFLAPGNNNDGEAFGLLLTLTDGTTLMLPTTATSNEIFGNNTPNEFELAQNYPNPFNPTTQISYALPQAADVQIAIYNMVGQKVATLVNGERQAAGAYTLTFDASALSSGIYLYRIQAAEFTQTRRMTLIK